MEQEARAWLQKLADVMGRNAVEGRTILASPAGFEPA
jgi:hypothetical protein